MQTIKTSEAIGPVLDWLVAKCEGIDYWQPEIGPSEPEYSTDWADGGPIIEREGICIGKVEINYWLAFHGSEGLIDISGPTPLIAAMRCYVDSKLGDTVEVPEELLTT